MGMSSAATLERWHEVAAPITAAAASPEALESGPRQSGSRSANPSSANSPSSNPSSNPLWKVWPGRDWPASDDEERALLADLGQLATVDGPLERTEPRRGDITAVLNALRCGLDAPDLLGRAPGLRPARLIAAHATLDARRRAAVSAWSQIASTPTSESLATWGDAAAALVPVVIGRLRDVDDGDGGGDGVELRSLVAACAADIDRVGRLAASVERDMSDPTVPPRRRAGLAALLFGSAGSGLWHHECYLAQRVGTLVPVRVAALLGENTAR